MPDLFSRKLRKKHDELRDKYEDLEDKYEDLQDQHDRLVHETGEQTNIRISYIEEEIESMNTRVEKLATDSYEIHSEVREIRESVGEMRTALSDIVSLYKAILMRYGFGNLSPSEIEERARGARAGRAPGGDPGDEIIEALRKEGDAKAGMEAAGADRPRSRTVPPRPTAASPSSSPSTLDELHRLSEEQRASEAEAEGLADRLATRSKGDDRVGRVAKRDMGRMQALDRDGEGEFIRSLPKKAVGGRVGNAKAPEGDWEAMEAPPKAVEDGGARKKTRMDDLLDPE